MDPGVLPSLYQRQASENPGDDMLGWLLFAEAGGEKLTRR
jgi:hypothetical protein